jgi:hypothetical protein
MICKYSYRLSCIRVWFMIGIPVAIALNAICARGEDVVVFLERSPLPSGEGLAGRFLGDVGVESHPDVIFADGFEEGQMGSRWDEVRNENGNVLFFEDHSENQAHLGKRCVKVVATLNENTGGGFTKWFESADRLFIRFYTKFDPRCDYVHHFCTLRANRGLQGGDRWSGFGGAGELPDGNRRFSTAIEPWGDWGNWSAPGRWNFYSYWQSMKPSPDGKYWGNNFLPDDQPSIKKDQWICVEFMLKHNTPGKDDGEQAFWIDGKLQGHWKGFNWRSDPQLQANALTVESYVTDRWTKQSTNIVYFDNVVIAKQYIGPSVQELSVQE